MSTLSANLLSCPLAGLIYRPVSVPFYTWPAAIFFSPAWNALLAAFPSFCNTSRKYVFLKQLAKRSSWGPKKANLSSNDWPGTQLQTDVLVANPFGPLSIKPSLLSPWQADVFPWLVTYHDGALGRISIPPRRTNSKFLNP